MEFVSPACVSSLRAELRRICAAEVVPLVVQLELTYACNLHCSPCRFSSQARRNSNLTLNDIDALLSELSESGTLYLFLSGGEVMCRGDFWEIAFRAKEKGFLVALNTNGTLIGPEEADRVKELSPSGVEVCLVGTSSEFHDRATGVPGAFNRTMQGVEALRDRGLSVFVQTLVADKGLEEVHGNPLGSAVPARSEERHASSARNRAVRLPGRQALEAADSPAIRSGELNHNERGSPKRHGMPREASYLYGGECVAGRTLATISPSGEVLPCAMLPVNLGNVRHNSFTEIWSSLHRMTLSDETPVNFRGQSCSVRRASLWPCLSWPCRVLR